MNQCLGFNLKNIEDGKFKFFYAHENITLLDRSKLVNIKDHSRNLKDILIKTDVIELCCRERLRTKWKFHKLTILTVFAALLKEVPMGCKDIVLPKTLLKNCTINCLTLKRTQDNLITTNCAFFVLPISICMDIKSWNKKYLKFLNCSSVEWMD